MSTGKLRAAERLLCCTAALLLAGCATTHGATYARDPSECPSLYLHYCTINNWGKTCGCMPKQIIEKILREQHR